MKTKPTHELVLALYPNFRGFGYAFLENPQEPRDCGIVTVRAISNKKCLKHIKKFIDYYRPSLVVLQDYRGDTYWKGKRTKKLLDDIAGLCKKENLPVHQYTREQVRFVFGEFGAKTKYEIAKKIVEWLPQLENKMPRVRKPWMCEDYTMGIFDAAALAITHFYFSK